MSGILNFRKATEADLPLLIDTIVEAEKSGTDRISYCKIFDLSENEFRVLLDEILREDIEGQELCISGFLIAEVNGVPAAAACAWVEGECGQPSTILKGIILHHFIGAERIAAAQAKLSLVEQIQTKREPGTLQIESALVKDEFRGKGLVNALFLEHVRRAELASPALQKVQLHPAASNERALRAYYKIGFKKAAEKECLDERILDLLPSSKKIVLENDVASLKTFMGHYEIGN